MICTYLGHSTFLLETQNLRLLFDPTVVPAVEQSEKPLLVFFSHRHSDHYNGSLFSLSKDHAVTYILSDDIPSSDVPSDVQVVWVAPHQRTQIGELQLETLRSTDEGVAFVLFLGEQVIYYAGDLNWWHWEGESEAYNTAMAEAYRKEMVRLPEQIDLAFVPVDPRLGSAYSFGVEGLLAQSTVETIVPMHMWDDYAVIERLQKKLAEKSNAIVALKRAPYTWRIK